MWVGKFIVFKYKNCFSVTQQSLDHLIYQIYNPLKYQVQQNRKRSIILKTLGYGCSGGGMWWYGLDRAGSG
jgi:hypothetical protein